MDIKSMENTAKCALACVAQFVGALSYKLKGCGFNSWSEHIPRLQVPSLVRACARGNL